VTIDLDVGAGIGEFDGIMNQASNHIADDFFVTSESLISTVKQKAVKLDRLAIARIDSGMAPTWQKVLAGNCRISRRICAVFRGNKLQCVVMRQLPAKNLLQVGAIPESIRAIATDRALRFLFYRGKSNFRL